MHLYTLYTNVGHYPGEDFCDKYNHTGIIFYSAGTPLGLNRITLLTLVATRVKANNVQLCSTSAMLQVAELICLANFYGPTCIIALTFDCYKTLLL